MSENSSGFGPRCVRRNGNKHGLEHIGQRIFTRQGNRQGGEVKRWSGGLNYSYLWLGLIIRKTSQFHHVCGIDAMTPQDGRYTASKIQG